MNWQKDRVRNILGYFYYYLLVFKNVFDILKGFGVYECIFLQYFKLKYNSVKKVLKKKNCIQKVILIIFLVSWIFRNILQCKLIEYFKIYVVVRKI